MRYSEVAAIIGASLSKKTLKVHKIRVSHDDECNLLNGLGICNCNFEIAIGKKTYYKDGDFTRFARSRLNIKEE